MKALLFHLDGELPNLALMRIAAHHRARGDEVELRITSRPERTLFDNPDFVYGSAIFSKTAPLCQRLKQAFPEALIGGTGWSLPDTLEAHGITTQECDYSIYPNYEHSIGFTQRGCRLKCEFCVVPRKEGGVREASGIMGIWRGDPWPRNLVLLDNDFFGQPRWRSVIETIRKEDFKVSFNQGINARCLTEEAAEAIASVKYYNSRFNTRRLYTAWDSRGDEERLFVGLNRLVKYGVKPDQILVYALIGFWSGETTEDRLYRINKLLDFGCRPFPMAYTDEPELKGMQRWAIGSYAKRISWAAWAKANYRPENLRSCAPTFPLLE